MRKNSFGQGLAIFLVIIGVLFVIGSIGEASEPKCIKAGCIASRGKVGAEEYPIYVKGIRDLRGHIYAENYSPEIAAGRATMVMYMVMCLLTDTEFEKVRDFREYANHKLVHEKLLTLRYLKKANPEAYAYVVKTDEIMK